MRLTPQAIDQLAQQTPCLCGDLTTWHARCYSDLSDSEIAAGYRTVYREAAKAYRQQVKMAASAAILAARNGAITGES